MHRKRFLTVFKKYPAALILLTFCLAGIPVSGQVYLQSDTIVIPEVVISRKKISSEQPGFKFYNIDSASMSSYSHHSLNDLLRVTTPLCIKEYGPGLSATSSFRGTSAGHTKVMWNGININDPMLGQTDFSLITTGMIDNIMICFGGAAMDLGSGAIGGIINLGTEPAWKKETAVDIAPGAGSFGTYSVLAKITTGTINFQSVTKAYMNSARNDFRYLDTEAVPDPMWKTREHNESLLKSFMQEFYFNKSGNIFSARLWYQTASRNLPGTTLYGYWGERQTDRSIRSLISYNIMNDRKELFATAAFIFSDMRYRSSFDTIGSKNIVNTLVLNGGITLPAGKYTQLKIVMNEELNVVESNMYSGIARHNNTSLTISAERKKGARAGAALLIRQTLSDRTLLIPDFSAGVEIRTLWAEEHYIKLNVSRNSKVPSLNDQFWSPGGNPDLENEYGYSFEAGYKIDHKLSDRFAVNAELNCYNNYIRNMIQWYPDLNFTWSAGNIGSVNTTGMESSLVLGFRSGRYSADLSAGYSYTRARDISDGATGNGNLQLIYIPEHQTKSSLKIGYRNFYASWSTDYSGLTYTSADNAEYLEAFTINTLTGGMKLDMGGGYVDLKIRIENIFNVYYRTIAYYPQPGRSFFLGLSFHFISEKIE